MYENTLVHGIHKSRYVASWINSGGNMNTGRFIRHGYVAFCKWLRTLVIDGTHLTNAEMIEITSYATNGKLELETSAKEFLK